jgi:hypothetical protein
MRSAKLNANERPYPTRVHTEGQRQAQAAGHLNLEGSSLHDGTEAGAGAVRRKPAL